jgi:hypothetical protein
VFDLQMSIETDDNACLNDWHSECVYREAGNGACHGKRYFLRSIIAATFIGFFVLVIAASAIGRWAATLGPVVVVAPTPAPKAAPPAPPAAQPTPAGGPARSARSTAGSAGSPACSPSCAVRASGARARSSDGPADATSISAGTSTVDKKIRPRIEPGADCISVGSSPLSGQCCLPHQELVDRACGLAAFADRPHNE